MRNGKEKNENGARDFSHLPRARDFKLPKEISPELKEAMEALRLEKEKYATNS